MGFPEPESGDGDPLKTACGTVLHITWTVTLHADEVDEDEAPGIARKVRRRYGT